MTFSADQTTINGYWQSAGCPLKSSPGPSLHRVFFSSQSFLSSLFSVTAQWKDSLLSVGRFLSTLVMNLLSAPAERLKSRCMGFQRSFRVSLIWFHMATWHTLHKAANNAEQLLSVIKLMLIKWLLSIHQLDARRNIQTRSLFVQSLLP